MATVVEGIVHGRRIDLNRDLGLPDGQAVRVIVDKSNWLLPNQTDIREALVRAAGTWSDNVAGLDAYIEWNRQQRKDNRREISE